MGSRSGIQLASESVSVAGGSLKTAKAESLIDSKYANLIEFEAPVVQYHISNPLKKFLSK